MTNQELCTWLRENSSSAYRPAAEAAERIEQLEAALKCLDAMYARAWDEVGGGLVFSPESVKKFEAAHRKAAVALAAGLPSKS